MSLITEQTLETRYVMPTFARMPVEFVAGKGMVLIDDEGRHYLDFLAGIGVTSLGHCPDVLIHALKAQAEKLLHVSNYFYIEGRGELAQTIKNNIGNTLEQYGIQLLAVETKSLDLPDENKGAVYERMISERNNIAATYRAEGQEEAKQISNDTNAEIIVMQSQADAQAEEIIAGGEAEYMRILSEAYNDPDRAEFYLFLRSLDAAKITMQGGNKTLIVDETSPIAQLFYQIQ